MKSTKRKIFSSFLLAFVFVAAAFIGVFHAESLGLNLREELVCTQVVSNESDIINMGGSFYNNICELANDITVSELCMWNSKDKPFIGVFDGKGYTINVDNVDIQKSLFGYIGEGGVVKNLHINVLSSEAQFDSKSGAIVALENKGTIVDCKVTVNAEVSVGGKHGVIAAYNYGTIKNVFIDAKLKNTCLDNNGRRSNIGPVAAYNYGEIRSAVVYVQYTNFPETVKKNIYEGYTNVSVGSIYSINNGTVSNCVAVISDETYVADGDNLGIAFVDESNEAQIFSAENLENKLGFDLERWILSAGKLHLIPQGEEE